MRRYLLDTTPVAALLHARPDAVALMKPWVSRREAASSMLVYGEVMEYIQGTHDAAAYQRALRTLFREIRRYPLNYRIMERYAELRCRLRPPHGPGLIGDIDTVIAAIALEHDLTVVTADSDFRRVPGLTVMVVGPFH